MSIKLNRKYAVPGHGEGMSKKAGDTNLSLSHRTRVEQLLKCYSANQQCKNKKADSKGVTEQIHIHRDTVTHCCSVSRHAEPRLRPRTCMACRTYITHAQKYSTESSAAIPSLLPLDQLYQLPYHPSRANKNRHKVRHGYGENLKFSGSRNLISCSFKANGTFQESKSSHGSGSQSRMSRLPEVKTHRFPALPGRTKSEHLFGNTNSISVLQCTDFSDAELRKWIIEFGGDEQAAYMARGLQKLQLAYEQGKAEMSGQTESETLLSIGQA